MVRITTIMAGLLAFACTALGPVWAQTEQKPAFEEQLAAVAAENSYRLAYRDGVFSGTAWDLMVQEGAAAQFFLLGEEHGVAENPKLAAALFSELTAFGYAKVAIEVSPPIATKLDSVLREEGLEGLRRLYSTAGGEPAFFGMTEEAEFLNAVRSAAPGKDPVLWGADYEVGGDRQLIEMLEKKRKPKAAREALEVLRAASDASWAQYYDTSGPQFIFSFSGDPALVRAVRDAWPQRDDETSWILETLEETLEINELWVGGEGWRSNERRGQLLRANFLRHWAEEKKQGRAPKVLAKFGASHLVRGRNMTETYDLGALLPELAAFEGGKAFSIMVLPGNGAMTAVLNPTNFSYVPAPAKDGYAQGLGPISKAAFQDAFTLIDMRPMRPLVRSGKGGADAALVRVVHGFDMLLVMSGSTPSSEFDHPQPDASALRP
ncbi:MAG: hypothetical protein ACX939_00500 [Hyphococcus sp.]